MDDSINDDEEDNTKVDYLNPPESGPGEEAAAFSAKAQKDKFLGGSSDSSTRAPNLPGGPYSPRPVTIEE